MRLNGWKRLGFMISLTWIVGLALETYLEVTDVSITHLHLLTKEVAGAPIMGKGDVTLVPLDYVILWRHLVLSSIVPIAILWGVGIGTAWVIRGFRKA